MVAYVTRMPYGYLGALSRGEGQATIEPAALNANNPFPEFGLPGKIEDGKFVPLAEGDAVVYGFLLRPYPTQGHELTNLIGPTNTIGDAIRRGYFIVKNRAGSPAKNGQVYVRVAAPANGKIIGGIEAVADGENTIPIPATFMGAADSDGSVEIAFNI